MDVVGLVAGVLCLIGLLLWVANRPHWCPDCGERMDCFGYPGGAFYTCWRCGYPGRTRRGRGE